MHKPIEIGIEDYLSGRESTVSREFHEHLAGCEDCRLEVEALREQAEWMQLLRAPAMQEPLPGFYARVMDRIEAQQPPVSFWSVLLEPVFARRLMYASLALFLVLGSAVWRTGPDPVMSEANPMTILASAELPQANGADPRHDREVVLYKLATFTDPGSASGSSF